MIDYELDAIWEMSVEEKWMLNRRFFLTWAGTISGFVIFAPGNSIAQEGAAGFEAGAKRLIEKLADQALVSLTETGLEIEERRERFRKLMQQYFAFDVIAKWVLGRYWKKASDPQKDEYLALFEKLMVITYADRFDRYAGEKLIVEKTETRGENDALVHSFLDRPNSQKPVAVIWRVRREGTSYKIVDVVVEGLSMGITQQQEFSSVIRNNNNQVEGLLSELRKRVNVGT